METIKYQDMDCIPLENAALRLLVTQSVGPRILSLRLHGGEDLFARLPDFISERPDGKIFHFRGGHRLWQAPESMSHTYALDDDPVDISPSDSGAGGLLVRQCLDAGTGIEKSLHISLMGNQPQVHVRHMLTNRGSRLIECAPWAITQLRTGGVAILPQSRNQTQMLPNRSLVLWPYTDLANAQVSWGNRYILVRAAMTTAFKIGFPNPRGWLAYWLNGTLFVKRAEFDASAEYYDFGSSSECFCNDKFLELETLSPIRRLEPGESVGHTETWELYAGVEFPADEDAAQAITDKLGLE
ncbi:MAG: hypothetical protein ACOY0R_09335 [Chloroflexota bacterium]